MELLYASVWIFAEARTGQWPRHSRRQVIRDVLLCRTSFEECLSFFHLTLLEGVRVKIKENDNLFL